jgi:hypothetical protein
MTSPSDKLIEYPKTSRISSYNIKTIRNDKGWRKTSKDSYYNKK